MCRTVFGVHHAITPDPYRGAWGRDDADAGKKYAADVKNLIDYATPGQVAAFIAESIQGVGGCVVFPDGYLKSAYEHVRAAGGLCIADEVQAGFGRTGTHFWGFETQDVIPDIVTMAKGIGNGCPLGAVVTTPKIAAALAQRIHFNTFGGNPVVCAQGTAVLEVIEREHLQANALKIGTQISDGLTRLKEKHNIIGDVRGKGLMLGIELVKDRATKEPAKAECAQIWKRAKKWVCFSAKADCRDKRFGSLRRCASTNRTPIFCWRFWIARSRNYSANFSGERRLPACGCRQLAGNILAKQQRPRQSIL